MKTKTLASLAAVTAIAAALAGCGGGSSSNGDTVTIANPPAPDSFLSQVIAIVGTTPENTEPVNIDAIVVTTPEDFEPSIIII